VTARAAAAGVIAGCRLLIGEYGATMDLASDKRKWPADKACPHDQSDTNSSGRTATKSVTSLVNLPDRFREFDREIQPRKGITVRAIYRIALTAFIGLALGVGLATHGIAQTANAKQQLVGTWLLVSEVTTFSDGKRVEGFGGNQKGILMFDGAGHYSSRLTGDARIKFAAGSRLQGTPEENKGVSTGSLSHFGTYSVNADGTTLTLHVERSSFPNWDGTDVNWSIVALASDELKLSIARTSSGGKAELVWKRAK